VLDSHAKEERNKLHSWKSRQNIPVSRMELQKAYLASKKRAVI